MKKILAFTSERRDEIQNSLFEHMVKFVDTIADAIMQVQLFKPDLVLAEWYVSGGAPGGAELLQTYQRLDDPKPPIMLMAGVPRPDQEGVFRQFARQKGANGFIRFPDMNDDGLFAEAVEKALGKKSTGGRRPWPRLPRRDMDVRMTVMQRAIGRVADPEASLHARFTNEVDAMAAPQPPVPDFADATLEAIADACGGRPTLMAILHKYAAIADPEQAAYVHATLRGWSTPSAWTNTLSALAFLAKNNNVTPAQEALLAIARYVVYGLHASGDILPD